MDRCIKIPFATWHEARRRLIEWADDPRYGPKPKYAYRCTQCGEIHLTKRSRDYARYLAEKPVFEQQARIKLEAQYWRRRLLPKRFKRKQACSSTRFAT